MNCERTIKSVIVSGLCLVPFVPLIISSPLFFPFITGKALFFRFIVGLVFVLWVALILLNKSYLPKKSLTLYSVLAFTASLSVSMFLAVDPYRSFWSNFERMEGLVTTLHLTAFFIVISSVFNNKDWWRFFHISLAVSFIISFYGLLQLSGHIDIRQGDVRLDGTLGNAIYLAVYLMFHIFISLYYFFQRSDKYKYFYLVLIILQAFVLYNTATRGVTLALASGLFVTFLLIFILEKNRKILRISAGIFLLVFLLASGAFLLIRGSDFVKSSPVLSRFSEISVSNLGGHGRIFVWPMAIKGFKERPIFGFGQENFIYVFSKNYNPAMYEHEPWFDRAHNVYLDWLVAGGLFGLIFFLLILILSFLVIWRLENLSRVDKSVLVGLLVGYMIQGVFDFDNLTSYIILFSILSYLCFLDSSRSLNFIFNINRLREQTVSRFVLPSLIVVFLFASYFMHYRPLLAAKNLVSAIHPNTPAEQSLEYFERVFSSNTFGGPEALLHFLNKTSFILRQQNIPEAVKSGYFDLAQKQIEILSSRFPKDARMAITIASFYNNLNMPDDALVFLERASELAPKKPDIYFGKAIAYFNKGEKETALDVMEFVYELEPRNPESGIRLALLLSDLGKAEKADSILTAVGDIAYFDDRILNLFINSGQFDRVLQVWQFRVAQNPKNIESRKSLVASFISLGLWSEAIEELENISEIDPNFKETADYAISEIQAGRGRALLSD